MKKTLDQIKAEVEVAFPSVFTKEDVITLLNQVQVGAGIPEGCVVVHEDAFRESVSDYLEEFTHDITNLVNLGSAEFEIDYRNQISVTSIDSDFDADSVTESIMTCLSENINDPYYLGEN